MLALALVAGLAGGYLLNTLVRLVRLVADPASYSRTDFFALWSYARLLLDGGATAVYDQPSLFAAQIALGRDPTGVAPLPFAYPPHFLLLIWPLGLLSHGAAYGAWIGVTLVLFLLAAGVGQRRGVPLVLALLAAPATSVMINFGQTGFLFGALLVAGLRLAAVRPVLAGLLLGLATCKPQLGLLVPLALAAAGLWRCFAAAAASTLVLAAVSAALFGPAIWATWLAVLPGYASGFEATRPGILHYMPTVTASLIGLGAPPWLVVAGQGVSGLAVAGAVWLAWRRAAGADVGAGIEAVCVLLAGMPLVASHAFLYDLPATTAGLLTFAIARPGPGRFAIAAILLALLWPLVMFEQLMPLALNAIPGLAAFAAIAMAVIAGPLRHGPARVVHTSSA
ncbi:MAG: DUF2029 domain-containing protein [Acetobacteraceae bacterium]|nr:DUF2029 domain-containing protein [Acetobacteraceae bacterium]